MVLPDRIEPRTFPFITLTLWRPKLIEANPSKSRSQNSRFGPMVPPKGRE